MYLLLANFSLPPATKHVATSRPQIQRLAGTGVYAMSDGGTRQALRLNGRQRCLHAQQEAGGWEMDGWIRGPPQSGSALLSSYLTAGSPLSTALAYTYDGNSTYNVRPILFLFPA